MKKFVSLNDSDLNRASGGVNGDLVSHGILPVHDKNGETKFITVGKKDNNITIKEMDVDTMYNIMGSDKIMIKKFDNTGKEIYHMD